MAGAPRITILTATAGAGHFVAALGLQHAFRAARPDADVEVVDVLKLANPFFRRLYGGGYNDMVRHAPTLLGWLYDRMDRAEGRVNRVVRRSVQSLCHWPTTRYLRKQQPDLVVNTHFLPAEIVAQLRRLGQYNGPQVTITTDYETHRIWVHEPTERYYTATDLGSAYLQTWGVPAQRIRVTGIPIRPGFMQPLARTDVRTRLGLDPERPMALLLCSGLSAAFVTAAIRELRQLPTPTQLVIITGRDEGLRYRLEHLADRSPTDARVVGFTDAMHEFLWAADIVIGKPGGLTVSETLACRTPLVVVCPIPGQETRNSDYLLEHGAAVRVNHVRVLGYRVRELLTNPQRLAALQDAAGRIARPDAATVIAQDALAVLAQA